MINNLKLQIIKEVKRYYAFCEVLDKAFKSAETPDDYYFKSCYTCFNGFVHSLESYLLSVYDDIYKEKFTMMPKSNANRILLRNCLESNLILNVLQNNPTYAEKFYATLASDVDRIKETYNEIDQTSIDLKKYMKRFSWLPRIKGKKCTSLKDILHFVDFGENDTLEYYYTTLIKNFDTFIHPSFKFAESIKNKKPGEEVQNIAGLFISNGIIFDCCYNCLSNLISVYEDKIPSDTFKELNKIITEKTFEGNPKYEIEDAYKLSSSKISAYIQNLPFSIINLGKVLPQTTYKNINLSYLLYDLSSHYDDMLVSYYNFDIMMFYAQTRYVIESLSLINCLLREDEARSEIYYLHQNIKSYDAKITALNFLNHYYLKGNEDHVDVYNIHVENVERIRSYYKKNFNQQVEDNKILRLNGWALYLKDINNEIVPNSPFFVDLMGNELLHNKEITHYLLGFYEESNAFTHITPYAFDPSQTNFDLTKPLLLMNQLMHQISDKIIQEFDLRKKLSHDEFLKIEVGLSFAVKRFMLDTQKDAIEQEKK